MLHCHCDDITLIQCCAIGIAFVFAGTCCVAPGLHRWLDNGVGEPVSGTTSTFLILRLMHVPKFKRSTNEYDRTEYHDDKKL